MLNAIIALYAIMLILLLILGAGAVLIALRYRRDVIKLQQNLSESNTSLANTRQSLNESNALLAITQQYVNEYSAVLTETTALLTKTQQDLAKTEQDLSESTILLTKTQQLAALLPKTQQSLNESNALLASTRHDFDTLKRIIVRVMSIAQSHPNFIINAGNLFVVSLCKYGSYKLDIFDIHVSRSLLFYGEWMDDEISLIGKMLQEGDVVFDVGANIGTHTIPFAKFVGPKGKVLAFEPQPKIVQTLLDNVNLNGLENVEIIPKVVCETNEFHFDMNSEDMQALAGNQAGVSFQGRERSDGNLSSVCLDQFIYLSPRLIKIDVEQMEINVLKGARKLINNSRPFIYMENHEQEFSAALLHEMFDLKYDCYWHLVPAFNPDNYLGMQHDIWSGKGFNINILCLPQESNICLSGLVRIGSEEEWITDKMQIDFTKNLAQYRIPVESIKGLDFIRETLIVNGNPK